jgi:hypothetical protein
VTFEVPAPVLISMRVRSIAVAAALSVFLLSGLGRAESDALPGSRGFQLALRTGAAVPLGNVSTTTSMSDAFGIQAPFIIDIGGKPIPHLFIGAFLGAAVGGAAGQIERTCEQLVVNCVGVGFRVGALIEWNVRPSEAVNPWFGYGFGYEIGGSNGSNQRTKISNSVRGFELGHFLAGVDFRLQEYFGIGPFVDAALGRYDAAESQTDQGGLVTHRGGAIDEKSFHVWLMLGVRAVLLP